MYFDQPALVDRIKLQESCTRLLPKALVIIALASLLCCLFDSSNVCY
jgi:hypothetical protein